MIKSLPPYPPCDLILHCSTGHSVIFVQGDGVPEDRDEMPCIRPKCEGTIWIRHPRGGVLPADQPVVEKPKRTRKKKAATDGEPGQSGG